MINLLLLQGIYYLAKSRRDGEKNNVPDCCEDCKHFRGINRKCKKGRYPKDQEYLCYDHEEIWDDDFDIDDMDDDYLDDDFNEY